MAAILRMIIMAFVTALPLTALQELFDGTVKDIVDKVKSDNGLSLDEAKDIVANILIDLSINAAAIGIVLRTKIAVKTAEFLGFTSKGYVKRTLSKVAASAAEKTATTAIPAATTSILKKVAIVFGSITAPIWLVNGIAATIEPGIYKPEQTNAVYKKLGIPFQYPIAPAQLKPGPFDVDSFKDYAVGLESSGVTGIENPIFQQSQYYSRQILADVVEYVYGQEVSKGNALTAKQIIPLLAKYLIIPGGATTTQQTSTSTGATETTTKNVQVFTGIISSGKLGSTVDFTARQDDLIESIDELQAAAQNNLSPFLAALPGKVIYEIKIVSSVTTADGFKQTGTTQKIQTGTYSNGSPKYKTVTNKFATLTLYILTDKGVRSKISTIVLGPTDSAKLTVGQSDLRTLETNIQQSIVTSNPADIKKVETEPGKVATVSEPDTTPEVKPVSNESFIYDGYKGSVTFSGEALLLLRAQIAAGTMTIDQAMQQLKTWHEAGGQYASVNSNPNVVGVAFALGSNTIKQILQSIPYTQTQTSTTPAGTTSTQTQTQTTQQNSTMSNAERYEVIFNPATNQWSVDDKLTGKTTYYSTRAAAFAAAGQTDTATASTTNAAALKATTLYDYYAALGQSLPSVSERATLYQTLGLGQATYYTGTAEQNTKLLQKLQGK